MKLIYPPQLKKSANAIEVLQNLEALANWVEYNRGWVNEYALENEAPHEPYIPDLRPYVPHIAALHGKEMPVVDIFETWLYCRSIQEFAGVLLDKYPPGVELKNITPAHSHGLAVLVYRAAVTVKSASQSHERRELMREEAGSTVEQGTTVNPHGDLLRFFQEQAHCLNFVSDKVK
jgi:hypothetical protein